MDMWSGTLWKGSFGGGVWIIIDLIDDFIYYAKWNQHKLFIINNEIVVKNNINFNSIRRLKTKMFRKRYSPKHMSGSIISYSDLDTPSKTIPRRDFIIHIMGAMSNFEFLYKLSSYGGSI